VEFELRLIAAAESEHHHCGQAVFILGTHQHPPQKRKGAEKAVICPLNPRICAAEVIIPASGVKVC